MDTSLTTSLPQKPQDDKQVCPLCSFIFAKGAAACGGCAFMGGCSMLKCPNCHYEFVVESKIVNWFQKLLKSHG